VIRKFDTNSKDHHNKRGGYNAGTRSEVCVADFGFL
jgi:hypothetical protein